MVEAFDAILLRESDAKELIDCDAIRSVFLRQFIRWANKEDAMTSLFHCLTREALAAASIFCSNHDLLVCFEDRAELIEIVFVGDSEWNWVGRVLAYLDQFILTKTQN